MLIKKGLYIEIASVPDREELVAELWSDDEMWGEIRVDSGSRHALELYPPRNRAKWEFDLDQVERVLAEARHRLC